MHQLVAENVSEYLEQNKDLRRFFNRLRNAGKKTFLVTNSPFHFVYVFQILIILIQMKLFNYYL